MPDLALTLADRVAELLVPPPPTGPGAYKTDPTGFVRDILCAEPDPWQVEVLTALAEGKNVAVRSGHGTGKRLAIDTPIPTPFGWTLMGDLRVGDQVLDEAGNPCRVTWVSPILSDRPCALMSFSDGSSLVADDEHQWATLTFRDRHNLKNYKADRGYLKVDDWRDHWDIARVMTTAEMAESLRTPYGQLAHSIPTCRPLRLPDADLPVPPYTLGAWLGDGTSAAGTLTAAWADVDHLQSRIESEGWKTRVRPNKDRAPTLSVYGLVGPLRSAGVLSNKHIPPAYLRASFAQRLELLRGLMDTDGFVESHGAHGQVGLDVTCEALARGAAELVRTFGWKVALRKGTATLYGVEIGPKYRLTWRPNLSCFRLPRKADAWSPPGAQSSRSTIRTVTAIERVPSVPTRCIAVDSPRSLYLAGESFIPTHNTTVAAWAVLWWLCSFDNAKVPATAPTEHQLSDLLWSEMATWIQAGDLGTDWLHWTATRLAAKRSPRTIFAVARTASTVEALAGFHAERLLFVVDEASGLADEMFMPVQGALSTEGARLLLIGNPTRGDGFFAKRFTGEDDPRWHTQTVNAENVRRVSKESIKAWADEYGADSDEYRVRVLGLPPVGEATGFIRGELVAEARKRPPAEPEGRLEIGVDVARYGTDRSAVVLRRGWSIVHYDTRRKFSNPQVAAWVMELVSEFRSHGGERPIVRVDDTGVGGGVTDLLRQAARDNDFVVMPMNFGAAADDKHYENASGTWWANVRKLLLAGMPLPDDDDLCRQLTDRAYSMTMRGKVKLEDKDHMRARGVPSPDLADAFVMAFFTPMGSGQAFLAHMQRQVAERELLAADTPVVPMELRMLPRLGAVVESDLDPKCQHRFFGPEMRCVRCAGTKAEEAEASPALV